MSSSEQQPLKRGRSRGSPYYDAAFATESIDPSPSDIAAKQQRLQLQNKLVLPLPSRTQRMIESIPPPYIAYHHPISHVHHSTMQAQQRYRDRRKVLFQSLQETASNLQREVTQLRFERNMHRAIHLQTLKDSGSVQSLDKESDQYLVTQLRDIAMHALQHAVEEVNTKRTPQSGHVTVENLLHALASVELEKQRGTHHAPHTTDQPEVLPAEEYGISNREHLATGSKPVAFAVAPPQSNYDKSSSRPDYTHQQPISERSLQPPLLSSKPVQPPLPSSVPMSATSNTQTSRIPSVLSLMAAAAAACQQQQLHQEGGGGCGGGGGGSYRSHTVHNGTAERIGLINGQHYEQQQQQQQSNGPVSVDGILTISSAFNEALKAFFDQAGDIPIAAIDMGVAVPLPLETAQCILQFQQTGIDLIDMALKSHGQRAQQEIFGRNPGAMEGCRRGESDSKSMQSAADIENIWMWVMSALKLEPSQISRIVHWRSTVLQDLDLCYSKRILAKMELIKIGDGKSKDPADAFIEGNLLYNASTAGYGASAAAAAAHRSAVDALMRSIDDEYKLILKANTYLLKSILSPVQAARYYLESYPYCWNVLGLANAVYSAQQQAAISS